MLRETPLQYQYFQRKYRISDSHRQKVIQEYADGVFDPYTGDHITFVDLEFFGNGKISELLIETNERLSMALQLPLEYDSE